MRNHRGLMAAAVRPVGAQPAAASRSTAPAPEAPMSGDQVIQVLDQTIDWYRTLGLQQQAAKEPSDLLILYENRQIANQVVGFAFDAARATADLLAKQSSGGPQREANRVRTSTSPAAGQTGCADILGAKRARCAASSSHYRDQKGQRIVAGENCRIAGRARSDQHQAEHRRQHGRLRKRWRSDQFHNGHAACAIDAMAVALPSASAASPAPADSAAPANARPTSAPSTPSVAAGSIVAAEPSRFGLWDLAANVFALSEKKSTVDAIDARSAALQATISQIRDRLVAQMRTLSTRGDALAAQADTADSAALTPCTINSMAWQRNSSSCRRSTSP